MLPLLVLLRALLPDHIPPRHIISVQMGFKFERSPLPTVFKLLNFAIWFSEPGPLKFCHEL